MTTPNIVPRFNEEGRVGRVGRRFVELHGKEFYADKLILNLPSGDSIIQESSSSSTSYTFDIAQGATLHSSSLSAANALGVSQSEVSSSLYEDRYIAWDPNGFDDGVYNNTTYTLDTSNGWPRAGLDQAQFENLVSAWTSDSVLSATTGGLFPDTGNYLFVVAAEVPASTTTYNPQHHLCYKGGRVYQGAKILAWKSEVDYVKDLVEAITSADGDNGLHTIISRLNDLENLDTFVELAEQVKVISDDYVTSSQIANVGSITSLTERATALEELTQSEATKLSAALGVIGSHSTQLSSLEEGQDSLDNFVAGADDAYMPKGADGATNVVDNISNTALISLTDKLTASGLGSDKLIKEASITAPKTSEEFATAFQANAETANLLANTALSTAIGNKLTTASLEDEVETLLANDAYRATLDLPKDSELANSFTTIDSALSNKVNNSDYNTLWSTQATAAGFISSADIDTRISTAGSTKANNSDLSTLESTLNQAIGLKANNSDLSTLESTLNQAIGLKANTTDVNTDLNSLNSSLSNLINTNAQAIAALPTDDDVTNAVNSAIAAQNIGSLVDQTTLNTTLDGYATDSELSSAVGDKVTSAQVQTIVGGMGLATAQEVSDIEDAITTENLEAQLGSSFASFDYATDTRTQSDATVAKLTTAGVLDSSGNANAMATKIYASNVAQSAFDTGIGQFEDAYDNKLETELGISLATVADTGSINWSAFNVTVGSISTAQLLVSSVNTFLCADPNIELNVGQPVSYLTEVEGGITWKRGEESYDAAILWDETNKYFHIRVAGPDTFRLLTVQDLDTLNARIDSEVSDLNSAISSNTTTLTNLINSSDTALGSRIDLEVQNRESADEQLQANIDSLSSSLTSEVSARNSLATSLQASINTEATSRASKDSDLEAQINTLNTSLSSSISSVNSSLASDIQALETSLANNVQSINSNTAADIDTAKIAVNARTDSEIASAKAELNNSIDSNLSLISEHSTASNPHNITKSDIGLANVENQAISSWGGSTNIGTVGTITEGTWNADPISSIANASVGPDQIDSSTDTVYSVKNLNVTGQISVSGQALQVDTTEVNIGDNIIRLNADATGIPTENAGFEVERGDSENVSVLWKEHEQEWSIGDKALETSGLKSEGPISLDSDLVVMNGSLEVAHIDITSNDSFNTTNGIIALNTDVRFPRYPWVGVDDTDGTITMQDPADVAEADRTAFESEVDSAKTLNIDATDIEFAVTDSDNLTDAGLKVVLGGYDTNTSSFNYAWLFWDVSANSDTGRWRLSESAPTTYEQSSSNSRTEFVDTARTGVNTYDVLHAGHIGATLGTGDLSASQIQPYSGDLAAIAGLSSLAENDFIVRGTSGWVKKTAAEVKTLLNVTDGVVELSGTQTIAGVKTFSSTIQGNISGNAATATSATQASNLNNHDTDSLSEGTSNLYYTDARVDSRIGALDTDSLDEGTSNLYYTDARVDTRIGALDTDSLDEGTSNLYYTDARVDTRIGALDTDSLDEGTTNQYHTTARARGSISVSGDLSYNSTTGVLSYTTPTPRTDAEVTTLAADQIAASDTDDLTEGTTNKYFTQARARASISENSTQLSYNSTTGTLTFTQGNTDTVGEGTSNLYYTDARARAAISENSTQLSYNSTTGTLTFTQGDTDTVSEGSTNQYFTNTRARSAISVSGDIAYNSSTGILSYSTPDSDGISEGSSNLYFTDERVDDRVNSLISASTGITKAYNDSSNTLTLSVTQSDINTDNITEGTTNLFTTAARTRGHISVSGDLAYNSSTGVLSYTTPTPRTNAEVTTLADSSFDSNIGNTSINALSDVTFTASQSVDNYVLTYDNSTGKWSAEAAPSALADTDELSEGTTNQYHTTARARSSISASGSLSYNSTTGVMSFTERTNAAVQSLAADQIAASNTDDLDEGTSNLYYSDSRARAAISENSTQLSYNSTTGVLTYTQGNTDTVSEGSTNKYFTNARARAAISENSTQLSYNSTTGVLTYTQGDTDTVSEGSSNLYFTDARARAAVSAGSGISVDGNGQFSLDGDQSSVISKINVASLFAKGSAWDRSTTTSGSDTTTEISIGYTTDSHTGPWKVFRQTKLDGSNLAFMDVSYKISSGVDQFKSLPDLNFTLTSSTSGSDTTHSLTLA